MPLMLAQRVYMYVCACHVLHTLWGFNTSFVVGTPEEITELQSQTWFKIRIMVKVRVSLQEINVKKIHKVIKTNVCETDRVTDNC